MIKLHDKYFEQYISEEKIREAVISLAKQVEEDHKDETPLFIGILNGCFLFVADFIREYSAPCEISFLKLASYHGTSSTGKVKQLVGINEDLTGRTVIILEDIIDTGNTLEELHRIFADKNLKELKTATLFLKPDVYQKDLPVDYVGMEIPDDFIVGYGLDYDGLGRNLASIYKLTTPRKMTNIVLFGPPGAGKGTQAEILKDKYNLVHISTGDVFRYNIKNETELGKLAKTYMDDGNLVPDEVTISMLEAEVNKNAEAQGFIFDGFPRTESQAVALDKFLETKGSQINGMVALEVPEDLLVDRILERGKTSGRTDDQDVSKIKNRFEEYNTKTAVLKDYYDAKDEYYGVDGVGSIEDITGRLSNVIDSL
ncbi:adenylate kinase [Aureivirga sp. CE67]|uniref:adenylate kinase n=1 Tax=Aureivirga sp. CE67 TaxID=1788983 RepID=UPI0018CAE94E|nr:adenylate kinase [Aureivirga sp. CE67]